MTPEIDTTLKGIEEPKAGTKIFVLIDEADANNGITRMAAALLSSYVFDLMLNWTIADPERMTICTWLAGTFI